MLFHIFNLTNYYINATFKSCSNLFRLTVATSFNRLTIRTELHFKREYLFRMCSVATNLVTSLGFQPSHCATKLFHFGRTRNFYIATRIILLSSTAESSATSGYVVAPERSHQSELWVSRNVELAKKKPSFVPNSGFNRCSMKTWTFLAFINFIFCTLKSSSQCVLLFSSNGNFFHFCLC